MEEKLNCFVMIGNLISIYRKNQINDIDLFNSIIRLINSSITNPGLIDRGVLKNIVNWLELNEENNTPPEVQYSAQNVKDNAGQDYFEGLIRVFSKDIHTEEYFRMLNSKFKNI